MDFCLQVVYGFDCGSGAAYIETTRDQKYNDGQWHTVKFSRQGKLNIEYRHLS